MSKPPANREAELWHAGSVRVDGAKVEGKVIQGKQLGREMGIPTANVAFDPGCSLADLPNGIYKVKVKHLGHILIGTASLGCNPQVEEGNTTRKLEVYVHNWDHGQSYYGERLEVSF